MANAGDTYTITLNEAHLMWGTHRYTFTRDRIYGEGYIPIPKRYAVAYDIHNSNYLRQNHIYADTFGVNLFSCTSSDGYYDGVLKSAGCSTAGDVYAKQFEGAGDLKALGSWFQYCGAQVGDYVEVTWTSPTDIIIHYIPQ